MTTLADNLAGREAGASCLLDGETQYVGKPIKFWVPGIPRPGGSKKSFLHPHTKRIIVTDDAKGNRDWKVAVKDFARQAYQGEPLRVPLRVEMTFYFLRPKGHFGSGRNAGIVRLSAPQFPAVKPDCLKLARSTEDAMTGIIYADDALIVTEVIQKLYAEKTGAMIEVLPL